MTFQNPAFRVLRRSVEGMEGMHSKMFDPPTESPDTPDLVRATNPVPEVMFAKGFLTKAPAPAHTIKRDLMHGMTIPTADGRPMEFFVFFDPDGINAAGAGSFPAPTVRAPRGCIFHCLTAGSGPPPHTIHWHGFEPTPMNDGVGHCSMELGKYTYQFQPNYIGSYFYHCHRNTVQHFEFGLYGFFIVDPPDAFFATLDNTNIPVGHGRPEAGFPRGRRRTAANLVGFPQFGQTAADRVPLTSPDPRGEFPTNPHAYTVPYHVEALWVLDDRDIRWSNLASNAKQTFPVQGTIPGVNDNFHGHAGAAVLPGDFFAFNDFNSTHFYVTGVNVNARLGNTGDLPEDIVIPPELMSGVSGVQVSVRAKKNQNVLLRVLNAAYNNVRITFPLDIVVIAWDGRALGVPPFGQYNRPVRVPAGTPMEFSVARRFDCLIRSSNTVSQFATVEFLNTRGRLVRTKVRIPIIID